MKEEPASKKSSAAGQNKDKERAAGPHNSVASLPLPPAVLEHTDKAERYGRALHPPNQCQHPPLTLYFSVCLSLKDGALSGKKKAERKPRQLLADLPLPPDFSGSTSSPHSPLEDKKSQAARRRPK